MFTQISTASKFMVFALSASLTWASLGTIAQSFQSQVSRAPRLVELAPVVVVGHRDQTFDMEQRATAEVRGVEAASHDAAI